MEIDLTKILEKQSEINHSNLNLIKSLHDRVGKLEQRNFDNLLLIRNLLERVTYLESFHKCN